MIRLKLYMLFWLSTEVMASPMVFTLFFNNLLGVGSGSDLPYPLVTYAALLPWTYFSTAVSRSSTSLVSNSHLVSKIYFPRLLIPVSYVLPGLVDFLQQARAAGMRLGVATAANWENVEFVLQGIGLRDAFDTIVTADDITLVVNAGPAAGGYAGKGAQFGGSYVAADGLTIPMEVVDDGVGTTNDGCEPLVGFTAGNIAFIDRGTCQFGLKALNAEQAGAAGAVIANDRDGTVIVLMAPGEFGRAVTIPVIAVGQNDGTTVRPTLPVSGTFDVIDVNGLHTNGYPLLYTPSVLELGSTISHYDITAAPSALMEPAINLDLYNDPDMTLGMYKDEGWVVGEVPQPDGRPTSCSSTPRLPAGSAAAAGRSRGVSSGARPKEGPYWWRAV